MSLTSSLPTSPATGLPADPHAQKDTLSPRKKLSSTHEAVLTNFLMIESEVPNLMDHGEIFALENATQVARTVANALAERCVTEHPDLNDVFQTVANATILDPKIMIRMYRTSNWKAFCAAVPAYLRQSCPDSVAAALVKYTPPAPPKPRNRAPSFDQLIGNFHQIGV